MSLASIISSSPQIAKPEQVEERSFEQIQSKNKDIIDKLVSEYGLDTLKMVCEKIGSSMKQKLVKGEEQLSEHEAPLRKKCQSLLVAKVKAANPKTLERIGVSESVINQVLLERRASELQTLAETEESLGSQYTELEQCCKKREKNIKENRILIGHFEKAYSKEGFDEVYKTIPEGTRAQIEVGAICLMDYIDGLRKKCEAGRTKSEIGTLPSKLELEEFFKGAKVVGYGEGYHGVFFVEGMFKGAKLKLVVKAGDKPAQEAFAAELASTLHIKTPTAHLIDAGKDEVTFTQVKKVLDKNSIFQEKCKEGAPRQFSIMTYVPGVTLEDLRAKDVEASLRKNSDLFYDKVLFEIGQMAALDLLLYYQDRLPTIGMGNLANVMVLKDEENQCIGAVGIDQVASLSLQESPKTTFIEQADPFKKVKTIAKEVASKPGEVSQSAKDIFDALDESVKEALDENRALQSIQKGIVSGLSKIATCSQKKLTEIHGTLPSSPYKKDQVDLSAYKKMLETIHTCLY